MTLHRLAVTRAVSGGVRATLRGRTLLAVVAIAFGIALVVLAWLIAWLRARYPGPDGSEPPAAPPPPGGETQV